MYNLINECKSVQRSLESTLISILIRAIYSKLYKAAITSDHNQIMFHDQLVEYSHKFNLFVF